MRKHIIVVMILALIFCAGLSVATVYAEEDTSLKIVTVTVKMLN